MAKPSEFIIQYRAARKSGDLARAQALLERALEMKPRNAWLWRQLVWVLIEDRQYAAALEVMKRAEQNVDIGDELAYYHGSCGICCQHLNRLEEAERYFRLSLEHEETWLIWHLLGSVLWRTGRDEESMECCRRSLRIKPDNAEILLQLANALIYCQGNLSESETLLRRAVEIDPDSGEAWSALGQLLKRRHSQTRVEDILQEARRTLQRALYLEPNDIWARLYFANTLWTYEELAAAEENFRRAYQDVPADDEELRIAAGAVLADFLSAEQIDAEWAEQLLRTAIAYDAESEQNNYSLGHHLYRYERDDEARPFLQFAAEHGHKGAAELLRKLNAPE